MAFQHRNRKKTQQVEIGRGVQVSAPPNLYDAMMVGYVGDENTCYAARVIVPSKVIASAIVMAKPSAIVMKTQDIAPDIACDPKMREKGLNSFAKSTQAILEGLYHSAQVVEIWSTRVYMSGPVEEWHNVIIDTDYNQMLLRFYHYLAGVTTMPIDVSRIGEILYRAVDAKLVWYLKEEHFQTVTAPNLWYNCGIVIGEDSAGFDALLLQMESENV